MINILTILVTSILTNNIIFSRSLGICPYLGVSKKMNSSVGMGLAVTFVLILSSIVCWLLYNYVLIPLKATVLQTLLFILIIAALVQMIDIILKRFSPALYNSLGVYLALITTNCCVLATANDVAGMPFLDAVFMALGVGVGFLIALVLMSGIREKMQLAKVPKAFQGFAIALVIAAIIAMAFTGIGGITFEEAAKCLIF